MANFVDAHCFFYLYVFETLTTMELLAKTESAADQVQRTILGVSAQLESYIIIR